MGAVLPRYTGDMTELVCGECGIVFKVPAFWYDARAVNNENNGNFFCPNGHSRQFREPEVDKLRRELAVARTKAGMLAREVDMERKQKEKLQRRAKAGVCPCCNRTFVALGRHMKTKHPDWAKKG